MTAATVDAIVVTPDSVLWTILRNFTAALYGQVEETYGTLRAGDVCPACPTSTLIGTGSTVRCPTCKHRTAVAA